MPARSSGYNRAASTAGGANMGSGAVRMTIAFGICAICNPIAGQESFKWPDGKRAAVSLSFDDGRLSQIDTGLALLKKLGLKVTFFVNPGSV
jgi:peptidoglycan/xylan/chitin deacetylase (PgdA/CDA1 family)